MNNQTEKASRLYSIVSSIRLFITFTFVYLSATNHFATTVRVLFLLVCSAYLFLEFVIVCIKKPISIEHILLFLCAVPTFLVVYHTRYTIIEKTLHYFEIADLNNEACLKGDDSACLKIANAALDVDSKHDAFPYFAKACAFENKFACTWLREHQIQ